MPRNCAINQPRNGAEAPATAAQEDEGIPDDAPIDAGRIASSEQLSPDSPLTLAVDPVQPGAQLTAAPSPIAGNQVEPARAEV
jgi:hypothetical protein